MKLRLSTIGATLLLLAGVASAVNGTGYYNLVTIGTISYLTQNDVPCSNAGNGKTITVNKQNYTVTSAMPGPGGTATVSYGTGMWATTGSCTASFRDTPENLYKILAEQVSSHGSFYLGTDLDLGGVTEETPEGECAVQHKPLPKVAGFNGNGFSIKNLCYVSETMDAPVGFFSQLEEMQFNKVKINGAKIIIKGASADGKDYYPVGAFTGVIRMATLTDVSVSNVTIDAPFAGAVAGLIENSSIKTSLNVSENVVVRNSTKITGDAAGTGYQKIAAPYKVFLGGVAGVIVRTNDDPTLCKSSVKVQEIKDLTVANESALGGVAGVLSASEDSFGNVNVEATRISGGSAMGGLFGYVTFRVEGESTTDSDIKMDKCSFKGEIADAYASERIYVGGIVGRDSAQGAASLIISNSQANLTLNDDVSIADTLRYSAGGILGANNCGGNGSPDESSFLTVSGSSTTGSINLSADATKNPGVYVRANVGGIAGAACLAVSENSFANDSSSMKIKVDVHSSLSDRRVIGGSPAMDTVSVGGLLGSADAGFAKNVTLQNLVFTGTIEVSDSLNVTHLGGVVGSFLETQGAKSISFKNVLLDNAKLITYTAVEADPSQKNPQQQKQVASVGGLCGYCNNMNKTELVGVRGGIHVTGTYSGDSLLVGGLFGSVYKAGSVAEFNIRNTYSIGDIIVDGTGDDNKKRVGYLVGSGIVYGGFTMVSNIHYSEKENIQPFGAFYIDSDFTDWKENRNISYVVRNGDENQVSELNNGTYTAGEMQKNDFAVQLNIAAKEDAWAFEMGDFDNLPFFAGGDRLAAGYGFVVTFNGYDAKKKSFGILKIQRVPEGGSATAPELVLWEGHKSARWDKSFDNITSNLTVNAVYDTLIFEVSFYGLNENSYEGDTLMTHNDKVLYGDKEYPPSYEQALDKFINRDGLEFKGWSTEPHSDVISIEYEYVTKDLDFYPVYDTLSYVLTMLDEDGEKVGEPEQVKFGADISSLKPYKAETDEAAYEFIGWTSGDVKTMPAKNLTLIAEFKKTVKAYTVHFLDYNGTNLSDTLVSYGDRAVAPAVYTPKESGIRLVRWNDTSAVIKGETSITADVEFKVTIKYGDEDKEMWIKNGVDMSTYEGFMVKPTRKDSAGYQFEFDGWDKTFSTLTGPTTYVARYKKIVPASSSSNAVVPPESSPSVTPEVATGVKAMADPLEVSGNAIRVTYEIEIENPTIKTIVYVVLDDSVKYPIADSLESETLADAWVLAPAPMGTHSVKVVVDNGIENETANAGEFTVASEITMTPKSWKMVSMAEAAGDLKDLASKTSIYWWDEQNPIGEYWQYRSFVGEDVEATRGFWYGTSVGKSIMLREGVATESFVWNLDSLYSGWNMVSNPTGWMIDLEDVLNNKDVLQVRGWNAETGAYDPVTVLKPYEAVWVQVAHQTQVTVAATPFFGSEKKEETVVEKMTALRKGVARKASAKNWSVLAVLKDRNGKSDSWNMIGAGANVEILNKAPMGMGDYVRLAIMDGKNKLAKSVKAVADEYEWTMKLSAATGRDAELSFEGVDALNQAGLSMTVTINGKTQEVMAGTPVKVALTKNTSVATVRVAPAAAFASNKMSGFAVSQVSGGLQLGFDAPENMAGANASYALVSVNGKKIASGSFKATAGTNSLNLKVPQSGLYFIQLKVGSQMASAKVMVK